MSDDELNAMEAEMHREQKACETYYQPHSVGYVLTLISEVRRLKRGEFSPDEFQSLCHHRDEKPGCTEIDFKNGCAEYWKRLFGEKKD